VVRMPPTLFRGLVGKSRDEIEQHFIQEERSLKASELKTYVFTAFNLQQFFQNFLAKKMPQALDQDRVEGCFVEEICRINTSLFQDATPTRSPILHEYLVRYLIMFYDHEYENSTLWDDFAQDFIYRHRHGPAPGIPPSADPISLENACRLFDIKMETLSTLTTARLAQHYRRLALHHHPDKGGSNEQFVALNDAYRRLLRRIKNN
jgi:hypothetical protein